MRILVSDADASFADSVYRHFAADQFAVQFASSSEQTQSLICHGCYDVVTLDLTLFGASGPDFIRRIRSTSANLAILVTTSSAAAEDHIRVLDAGADDCLIKPFALPELAARIRAVLRRGTNGATKTMLTVGDLALDRVGHTVHRRGRPVDLSPKEFALLEFLMRHAGQPVTRSAICEQVWKTVFDTTTNVVDVYINYLRRKIDSGHDHALIRTIRGIGYQIGANGAR